MKFIDDNFDDYFEGNAPKKRVKAPYVETEEEREERELNETTIERRSNKKRISLIIGSLVLLFFLFFLVRCQYFNPEVHTTKGVVVDVVLKGTVFKTYECTFNEIDEQSPNGIVKKEFKFSVTNDSIAKTLNELKQTNIPIQIHYREYRSSLPWRGDTKFVADSISTQLPIEYVNTIDRTKITK
ncbi:MAG: hypothetical protein IKW83_01130 [Muribaculaceae bacterium]|nr:hypothetical protein [Muribaculaceae bacterium]